MENGYSTKCRGNIAETNQHYQLNVVARRNRNTEATR